MSEKFTRRNFVKGSAALVGASILSKSAAAQTVTAGATASMPKVTLGHTGAKVSRMAVGCGRFRQQFLPPSRAADIVHRALELGVNYIDVAPNYGEAEDMLGEVMPEIRDKVFLVTKTE